MKRLKNFNKVIILLLILTSLYLLTGCDHHVLLPEKNGASAEHSSPLLQVEVHFDNNQVVTGYVKGLFMAEDETIYAGGPALKYLYDAEGNLTGCINYQRVLYVRLLKDNQAYADIPRDDEDSASADLPGRGQ